jgi:hypothetical protein
MKNRSLNKKVFSCFGISFCLLIFLPIKNGFAQNAAGWGNSASITGPNCSAYGSGALVGNSAGGNDNSALGKDALNKNTNGDRNTAAGKGALLNNDALDNAAVGYEALKANTTGEKNSAAGAGALSANTSGDENTALGYQSLISVTTVDENSGLGAYTDINGSSNNQTMIGYGTIPSVTTGNVVTMGNANVTLIESAATFNTNSDRRIKDNIRESKVKGLEFILKITPVIYNLNVRLATANTVRNLPKIRQDIYLNQDFTKATDLRRSGFLAQEVEAAAASCGFEFSGLSKPIGENGMYSLAYSQFVMPLVKAVQEQQAMIKGIQSDLDQIQHPIDNNKFRTSALVNGENIARYEDGFLLEDNKPNPFSEETIIAFYVPSHYQMAILIISDLTGKQFLQFPITSGSNSSVAIKGGNLAPGIYNYSIETDGVTLGRKRMIFGGH